MNRTFDKECTMEEKKTDQAAEAGKVLKFKTVGEVLSFVLRMKMPIAFRCAHCRRLIVTDPERGDKRFRFCSASCEKSYWRHNSGRKSSVGSRWGATFRICEDGILRENIRDKWN